MRRLIVALLAAAAVAAAPAAQAATPLELDSGGLRVRVQPDPFALEWVDERDGDVLRTVGRGASAPEDPAARYGPLGFSFDLRQPVVNNAFLGYYVAAEAPTVWFHATRVAGSRREGEALVVEAATNDPLGHRLELRIAPAGEGGATLSSRVIGPLASRASVSGAAFRGEGGERHLGFGERSNAVDQTGNRVFSWAEEGPFSSGNGEALRPLIPDFTFPTGPTGSNFPIPWSVSTRGFGVLVDQTQRSTFHLRDERGDAWRVEAEAPELRLTVFAGPKPADVVRRYSAYAGRQPDPAPWLFGPWFQPTLEKVPLELARRFRDEDVPVTVAQTYTHYLPCGDHRGKEADERSRVESYHRLGYKITTYFNPHVCRDYQPVYDEAARNGWLVKNRAGQPYLLSNPFTADEQVSEIDFTAPGAAGFFHRLLDQAIDTGYDGWMEDFGEYTPTDAVFANGEDGLSMHNRYPVIYHAASYEHTRARMGRDAAVFVRSGFHGVQPHARVVWGGDPTEDWSCSDGLCAAVHQALSTGLSGVAYWGSDIGGFHAVVNPRTSDELNARWLELGAVSGVMRTQANGFSFGDNRASRSQVWHPRVFPIWRRYAKLRTQLLPYLEAASEEYQRSGMPISRHLALRWPDDPQAARRQTEFLFGPDLLAAPVVEAGARRRTLYLPPGQWVELWRAAGYEERSGELHLGRAELRAGGREATVDAPLDELPLFARAGALIPLLPADVDTLADEGSGSDLVHLKDRRDELGLMAFPRGASDAALAGGDRISSVEGKNAWLLRIKGKRRRLWNLEASLATLKNPFTPRCVRRVGGRPLRPGAWWRYDAGDRVLRARFRATSTTLRITADRCPRRGRKTALRRRR